MSTDEMSICIIESWARNLTGRDGQRRFCQRERKRVTKLLVGKVTTEGEEKIPIQEEYDGALESRKDINTELSDLGCLKLTCLQGFDPNNQHGFLGLVHNPKSKEFPKGNCKIT